MTDQLIQIVASGIVAFVILAAGAWVLTIAVGFIIDVRETRRTGLSMTGPWWAKLPREELSPPPASASRS